MSTGNGKPVGHNRIAGKLSVPLANHANGQPKNGQQRQSSEHNGAGSFLPLPTFADSPSSNGQDAKGRFKKGNKASEGNPFARRAARLRTIALAAVTDQDVRAVVQKLLGQAKAGDVAAAKLLLAYVIGKPTQAVDPDRVDLDEFRLLDEYPTPAKVIRLLLDGLPPDLVVDLARDVLPKTPKRLAKALFKNDRKQQILGEQRARIEK